MATMGVREYDFQVPYGAVNVDGDNILSIVLFLWLIKFPGYTLFKMVRPLQNKNVVKSYNIFTFIVNFLIKVKKRVSPYMRFS